MIYVFIGALCILGIALAVLLVVLQVREFNQKLKEYIDYNSRGY